MDKYNIYEDISKRTGGDIFIGVVGPVRTGKSTFIAKFMDNFVIPNINNKLQKQIATDEMPQSSDGKTIMTTQPKFVPANAVKENVILKYERQLHEYQFCDLVDKTIRVEEFHF